MNFEPRYHRRGPSQGRRGPSQGRGDQDRRIEGGNRQEGKQQPRQQQRQPRFEDPYILDRSRRSRNSYETAKSGLVGSSEFTLISLVNIVDVIAPDGSGKVVLSKGRRAEKISLLTDKFAKALVQYKNSPDYFDQDDDERTANEAIPLWFSPIMVQVLRSTPDVIRGYAISRATEITEFARFALMNADSDEDNNNDGVNRNSDTDDDYEPPLHVSLRGLDKTLQFVKNVDLSLATCLSLRKSPNIWAHFVTHVQSVFATTMRMSDSQSARGFNQHALRSEEELQSSAMAIMEKLMSNALPDESDDLF